MKDLGPIDEGADFVNKTYVDAADALSVHLAGTETITGAKTFSAQAAFNAGLTCTSLQGSETAYTTTTTLTTSSNLFGTYNASGGAFTVTLPSTGVAGLIFVLKKIDATANAVTISPGGGTIDGQSSVSLTAQYDTYWLESTSSSGVWRILAKFPSSSGSPTGAAGGDLTGTYPNPTLAASIAGTRSWTGQNTFGGASIFANTVTVSAGSTYFWMRGSLFYDESTITATGTLSVFAPPYVLIDASAGSINLTLPATTIGGTWYLRRIDSVTTNTVTITAPSGGSIDGASTITLPNQYEGVWLSVGSTTSTWRVMSRINPTAVDLTSTQTLTGAKAFFGRATFTNTLFGITTRTPASGTLSTTSNTRQDLDATTGAFSTALPATGTSGIVFIFKRVDSTPANAVSITATSIDGAASISLAPGDVIWVQSSSTSGTWRVLATYPSTSSGGSPTGIAGGDLNGSYPNPTVDGINGVNLGTLATGILKNTTSTGVPSIAAAADIPTVAAGGTGPLSATDTSVTNSRTPTGTASGDLSGSYPSPAVAKLSGPLVGTPNTTVAASGGTALGLTESSVLVQYLDTTSGAITVTPSATTAGRMFLLVRTASANTVTLNPPSAGTLDGSSSSQLVLTSTWVICESSTKYRTLAARAPQGAAGGDLGNSYPTPAVVAINGTNLAGLATGILKNTTTSGTPSIAVATDIPVAAVTLAATGPADNAGVVHKTGTLTESIDGAKTFTTAATFNAGATFAISQRVTINNLRLVEQAYLAAATGNNTPNGVSNHDSSAGAYTHTLGTTNTNGIVSHHIKTDTSTNAVTIAAAGTGNINGFASVVLRTRGDAVLLETTGTSDVWRILSRAYGRDNDTQQSSGITITPSTNWGTITQFWEVRQGVLYLRVGATRTTSATAAASATGAINPSIAVFTISAPYISIWDQIVSWYASGRTSGTGILDNATGIFSIRDAHPTSSIAVSDILQVEFQYPLN